MEEDNNQAINDLCEALIYLKTKKETYNFLKDLCTPQEIATMAERWRVCKLLNKGDLSYRQIHEITKASLTTIGRVARFLKDEPYKGYKVMLKKTKK
jgi:TrpR-related protein YerC/YecD